MKNTFLIIAVETVALAMFGIAGWIIYEIAWYARHPCIRSHEELVHFEKTYGIPGKIKGYPAHDKIKEVCDERK